MRLKERCSNGLRAILFLTCCLAGKPGCAQKPSAAEQQVAEQRALVSVRLVLEDGSVLSTNPSGLAVELGKPVDKEEVATSIRTLYQTGDYADIKAMIEPDGQGVRLDFVVRESLFINQVIVEGLKPPPSDSSAVAAMQLLLGQTYYPRDVDDAMARLLDTLRDEGLYQAKVQPELRTFPATHQIDVIAQVTPGERVKVGKIELLNNTDYRDTEILAKLKFKPGTELTSARLQSGIDRIRKFLLKTGHLSGRVSVRRGDYDAASNTLPLTMEVSEGPLVRVQVAGAKFSKGELKRLVPIYQEGSVDTDLLEEGKRNLRERLEREGFFDAKVDYSVVSKDVESGKTGWKGAEETITYKVERGDRHKLLRIEFNGNHYFSAELLRSRLNISASSLFVRPRFSRRLLELDVDSMKNLYAANGFLSAKVTGQVLDNFEGKTGNLVIRFQIEEGKQTLVSNLTIEGEKVISEEEIRGVVGSLPGQPYSDINIATDRDNILALYFNQGFPNASFSWTSEPDPKASSQYEKPIPEVAGHQAEKSSEKGETLYKIERSEPMKLVYKIVEGAQIRVKHVLLAGYKHTRERVIRREVKVKPDQPLREGEVVESQQKLYNLGIFNRVTIEPQNASGTDPEKDVVVLVEEAKRYTIAYGGGFEVQRLASTTDPTGGQFKAAPRGILEFSKQNVTGRADTLALKLRGSTIQGRVLLAYSAPNIFNLSSLSFQATAYVEKTQDINTFSQTRYEGNLQLTQKYSSRASLLYRYAFRKVNINNLNIPEQEIPLFNQPTLVSEFSVTWFRDTRNNPADATKGAFNTADISVADTAIGSSASFVRFFIQNSTYTPITKNWSVARSLRLGLLQPYRDTVSLSFPAPTTTPVPQVIPLPERLFGGGGTSLRGFALNQAGPRDALTGFPVGGQALLIANQEVRFPLKLPFIGTRLGGAFFYDGGNVYSRLSRITLRWKPPEPVFKTAYPGKNPGRFNPTQCVYNCTNELNYFSHTVGFGLRYATPVGPIRIDLGYELNQPQFVIPCRSGVPFCQQGTRLNRFQIFFNLGSSF
jgi:outer membrane protein insertion porin family